VNTVTATEESRAGGSGAGESDAGESETEEFDAGGLRAGGSVGPEPVDPDDDMFDESWNAPKKSNRLTVALVVALLVVAGFAGGVLVQKHHDVGLAAAAAGVAPRRAGGTGGGNGGGRGQGASSSAAPAAGADAGAGAGGTATGAPVVEGTVRTVNKDSIEVTDGSGAVVRVFVPQSATVSARGLGGLAFNNAVSVAGTKEVDGSVTATSVTVRATGG
jgi:hypothetical protein